jgi:very-short-patch-repair endonuclease
MQSGHQSARAVAATDDEVLVAILNHPRDFTIARDSHWYRIPVLSAQKWLRNRWPPQWLAFYHTKIFETEAFAIHHYAKVLTIREVLRRELFPEEPNHPKAQQPYYQLMLGSLQQLPQVVRSARRRRIVFIRTNWRKFSNATEINDLYDDSPLEDLLWEQIKRLSLTAERQEFITANGSDYALDFAFHCKKGKLDVETDGDTWHGDPQRIAEDNRRDNDLESGGWKLLRFNTYQLREQMVEYCIPTIIHNVKQLGGLPKEPIVPREADPSAPAQLGLFDD